MRFTKAAKHLSPPDLFLVCTLEIRKISQQLLTKVTTLCRGHFNELQDKVSANQWLLLINRYIKHCIIVALITLLILITNTYNVGGHPKRVGLWPQEN